MIKLGEYFYNPDELVMCGPHGKGEVYVEFTNGTSLSFEGEEAEALKWFLQEGSKDIVLEYRSDMEYLAEKEVKK